MHAALVGGPSKTADFDWLHVFVACRSTNLCCASNIMCATIDQSSRRKENSRVFFSCKAFSFRLSSEARCSTPNGTDVYLSKALVSRRRFSSTGSFSVCCPNKQHHEFVIGIHSASGAESSYSFHAIAAVINSSGTRPCTILRFEWSRLRLLHDSARAGR